MRHPVTAIIAALLVGSGSWSCTEKPPTAADAGPDAGGGPATTPSPVIAAAGDIADCQSTGDEATALLIEALRPDALLALGDVVYENGTPAEFTDCYAPSWGRYRSLTHPAPGNHEYNTPAGAGYYGYFGDRAGPDARGYYSFDLGAWHLISLNSNVAAGAGSAQLAWLRADLASTAARCALAYWHHPVISSGPSGNNPQMREIWRVLDSAGVDVVLVGHDHLYERFAAQDVTGRPDPTGIREFVVGTGGRSLHGVATIRANSEIRNADSWGILKMTLNPTGYGWQFVPVAGRTFTDQGSAECVGVEPDAR